MYLFVIYIGGKHKDAFIELHDIRFILAQNIEDTYEELKNSWWGEPETLHLDCWGILKSAGNYNIHLKKEPANSENKLFFVNLGGYDTNEFTELHKNVFIVAQTEMEAKIQAKNQIQNWESPHKDYLYETENIINLNKIAAQKNFYIHLEPTDIPIPFEFTCKYVSIGKKPS